VSLPASIRGASGHGSILLPIMLGSGTGPDVMRRAAVPMVGGLIRAAVLTLALIPAIFLLWQRWRLGRQASNGANS
jgi:Cu(I)/Ag(I) efflux system membrane protein CusA/SilA